MTQQQGLASLVFNDTAI